MRSRRFAVPFALVLGAAAALFGWARATRAGERPLELVISNLTPDAASSAESKRCVQTLREGLAGGGATLYPVGETPLRALVGRTDKTESFLGWTKAELAPVLVSDKLGALPPYLSRRDALVAVDCRPEQRTLDVLFFTGGQRGVLHLRALPLSRERVLWMTDELLTHLWSDFEL
jgi:hypothetical protein